MVYPEGVAAHIIGTHFMFNLHYQATGRATTDKTRIGLWLQKGPVTHELRGSTVSMGSEVFLVKGKELTGRYTAQVTQDVLPPGMATVLNIPAFAENYRLTNILPVRREMTVYAFQPHMHLRGKSMKYTAVYPDGREEVLINVPKYDFNWQIVYELAKPITLPAGSAIRVEATWDNSAKNKYNPRPDQEVRWGEQSWDEMLSPLVYGSVRLATPVIPVAPQLAALACLVSWGHLASVPRDKRRCSMKQSTSIVWLLVFAAVGGAHAQGPPSEPKSDQAPIVEAVGCVSQTGANWILANATDAAVSRTPFTTPEAVKAAAEKPLGTQRYRLLGTSPFSPIGTKGTRWRSEVS